MFTTKEFYCTFVVRLVGTKYRSWWLITTYPIEISDSVEAIKMQMEEKKLNEIKDYPKLR